MMEDKSSGENRVKKPFDKKKWRENKYDNKLKGRMADSFLRDTIHLSCNFLIFQFKNGRTAKRRL
jgi:hypothetical protein